MKNTDRPDSFVFLHGRSWNHVLSGSSVCLNNSRMLFVNASVGVRGKVQSSSLCGVRIHTKVDHAIVLDQTSCVNNGINPINVETHRDLDRLLTSGEITTLQVCESNAVASDTDWTTACGGVERDAIEDITTTAQIYQRDTQTCVRCQTE